MSGLMVVAFMLGLVAGMTAMRIMMRDLLRQAQVGEDEAMKLLDDAMRLLRRGDS